MAIKKVIEIQAKVGQAVKEIKDLFNAELEAVQQAEELNKELDKTGKDGAKSMDNATKSTKGFTTAIKGIGTALKAVGIGLLISAFAALTSILSENQTVVDKTKQVFIAFKMAVGDVIDFIVDLVPDVRKFFDEFGADPTKKIKELGESLRNYLLRNLVLTSEALGLLGSAVKEFFKGNFGEGWDKIQESASKFADAISGQDDILEKTTEKLKSYYNEAGKIVDLQNNAKISKALLQGQVEEYDRLAEQQRQQRDLESNTLQERLKASNKLKEILNQQEKAQLALAGAIVKSAEAEYNLSKTIDNQVALIEARNEAKAVQAQIEGFRSEQLQAQESLEKELIDLNDLAIQGINKREKANEDYTASLKVELADRLEAERLALVDQGNRELDRLTERVKYFKEGTTAHREALEEQMNFEEEHNILLKQKEAEIEAEKRQRQYDNLSYVIESETISFGLRLEALQEYDRQVLEDEKLTEQQRTKILQQNADTRKKIQDKERDGRLQAMSVIGQSMQDLGGIMGEHTALGKTLAVAGAIIDTYASAVSSYNGMVQSIPGPWGIAAGVAAAVSSVAMGLNNVKQILAVKVPNDSSGGSVAGAPQAQPPAFNIVGQSSTNQLAQTIAGQEQEPIKAYVVSKDITTQQNLDTNIRATASF